MKSRPAVRFVTRHLQLKALRPRRASPAPVLCATLLAALGDASDHWVDAPNRANTRAGVPFA